MIASHTMTEAVAIVQRVAGHSRFQRTCICSFTHSSPWLTRHRIGAIRSDQVLVPNAVNAMPAPNTEEVTFVVALPNWEVLYYLKDGDFKTESVVAWGVILDSDGKTHVHPVLIGDERALSDIRPLLSPDGDVSYGAKSWPTVWAWLDDMKKTDAAPDFAIPRAPAGVTVLDSFRNRFAKLSSSDN